MAAAVDGPTWSLIFAVALEAALIAGLVVKRRRHKHGRRIRIAVTWDGRDTDDADDVAVRHRRRRPAERVTPPE